MPTTKTQKTEPTPPATKAEAGAAPVRKTPRTAARKAAPGAKKATPAARKSAAPARKAPAAPAGKRRALAVVEAKSPPGPRRGSRYLVVVESPAKAKTIKKYLGSGYAVKASVGHVMDLPKSKLGIDVKHDFRPEYHVIPSKEKALGELKKAAVGRRECSSPPTPTARASHRLAHPR
jgi:DNA topoisomerase-1